MTNPFDPFRTMNLDFTRLRDALGIERLRRLTQFVSSIAAQVPPGLRSYHSIYDSSQQPHIKAIAEQIAMTYQSQPFYESMHRRFTSNELLRAGGLASTLTQLSMETAKLFGGSSFRLSEIHKTIGDLSRTMGYQLESTKRFDAQLGSRLPTMHHAWLADLERTMLPWLPAHEAIWPHDVFVLRMLKDRSFGVGSWLHEPSEPEVEPHFALAALSNERPPASTPIDVTLEVCCALCGGAIYTADAAPSWVGPKLDLKIRIVPICIECTERDAEEPGYLRDALRQMIEGRSGSSQPQLEIFGGDETDPVPRGALTLVRDEEPDNEQ